MIFAALAVGGTSIWFLYQAAFEEQRNRLIEVAQSQARLIESIARFDAKYSREDYPGGAISATLSQIIDAHKKYKGFGETGEFTLAKRQEENIVFLLSHRHMDLDAPKPVPWDAQLAEPMRRALQGLSGSIIGLDYRGVMVLAAHEPLAVLNAGIVAKIDMAEIRAPFLKAGAASGSGAVLIFLLGTLLFRRASAPLLALERSEQALRQSERQYRDLIDGSVLGILIRSRAGRRLYVNKTFLNMFGYDSAEEFLSLSELAVIAAQHEKERLQNLRNARIRGEPASNEYEFDAQRKDGSIFPVQNFVRRLVWNGEDAIQSTFIDLTRRKRDERRIHELNAELEQRVERRTAQLKASEERARVQFNNSPVPMHLWERSGDDFVQIDCNDAADARSGGRIRQRLGEKASVRFAKWPEGLRCLERCYAEKTIVKHLGQRPILETEEDRWIETTFVFVPPDRVILHAQDISEQKQAEEALRAAKEEAERANASKSRFLAAASHDLRQPLQALSLFSVLLKDQLRNDEDRLILENIDTSVGVMADLLDTLLDISKLEAGAIRPDIIEFPVSRIIEKVKTSLSAAVMDSGTEFRTITSRALVRSDPTLLQRIIENFVSNAIQHSGGKRVLLGCRRRGNKLRVEIWDDGKGIPEAEQQKIFEELYQLDNTARDRRKGFGLGLALVDRLSKLLGHPVGLSSSIERGSVFWVELPLGRSEFLSHKAMVPETEAVRSGILVAVIEDEPILLTALRLRLETLGYDVVAAASGKDAITMISDSGRLPRLVISDYRLDGGERGTDAIRNLQDLIGEEIPGIILTGDTSSQEVLDSLDDNIRVLHKPVPDHQFVQTIASFLTA